MAKRRFQVEEGHSHTGEGASQPAGGDLHSHEVEKAGSIGGLRYGVTGSAGAGAAAAFARGRSGITPWMSASLKPSDL
jgi:hypothetical protein